MVILGTSQSSSTPPRLYPFGMPRGGSVKHSPHHSDSDLPQIPSGGAHCVIPSSLPAGFSQGWAHSTGLQLPSCTTKGWIHIPKYTALKNPTDNKKERQWGCSAMHPTETPFKTTICVLPFLIDTSKELLRISLCRLL